MKFKIGQTVEVVDNHDMAAPLGATAVVTRANHNWCNYELIVVVWKTNSNNQMGGGYESYHFKSALRKGEQLLFSFMEQENEI